MKTNLILLTTILLLSPLLLARQDNGFNTVELVERTVKGDNCLNYCLTGVCAHYSPRKKCIISWGGKCRLRVTVGYDVFLSPKIEHSSPDLLVQVYDQLGQEPWTEWANSVGTASKAGFDAATQNAVDSNLSGGYLQKRDDIQRLTALKEASITGNPAVLLTEMMNAAVKGNTWECGILCEDNSSQSNSTAENHNSQSSIARLPKFTIPRLSKESLDKITTASLEPNKPVRALPELTVSHGLRNIQEQQKIINASGSKLNIAQGAERIKQLSNIGNTVQNIKDSVNAAETFVSSVEGSLGSLLNLAVRFSTRFDRALCPTQVRPLTMHYSSSNEFWAWRLGFPFIDARHATTILNPASTDIIGSISNKYGHLYPRNGWTQNLVPSNRAAVIATRAKNILDNEVPDQRRAGIDVPSWRERGGFGLKRGHDKWQLIYPKVRQCKSKLEGDSSGADYLNHWTEETSGGTQENAPYRRYAWSVWRQYACCTGTKGTFLTSIQFSKICI